MKSQEVKVRVELTFKVPLNTTPEEIQRHLYDVVIQEGDVPNMFLVDMDLLPVEGEKVDVYKVWKQELDDILAGKI